MDQIKIMRINELAKKAKEEGLSAEESAEQQSLRQEYLAAVRANLRHSLDQLKSAPHPPNCSCSSCHHDHDHRHG